MIQYDCAEIKKNIQPDLSFGMMDQNKIRAPVIRIGPGETGVNNQFQTLGL